MNPAQAVSRTLRVADRADLFPGEQAALRFCARRTAMVAIAEQEGPDPEPAVVDAIAVLIRRAQHQDTPEAADDAAREMASTFAAVFAEQAKAIERMGRDVEEVAS